MVIQHNIQNTILISKNKNFHFIYETYCKNMYLLYKTHDIIHEFKNIKLYTTNNDSTYSSREKYVKYAKRKSKT